MYQTPKFAGAVRYNAPKGCATRLCRACVELTVCVAVRYPITANISRNKRNGNPTAVPYFRSGRRSLVCARLSNKGKVGVQRGRETAGVPSSLPQPRARQSPALRRAQLPRLIQAKNSPPVRNEHAHAVRAPRTVGAEKRLPPGQGVSLTQSVCPGKSRLLKFPF